MRYLVLIGLLLGVGGLAHAGALVTGVNIVNPLRASAAEQTALIGQLKAENVRVVRCGLTADARGMAFAQALYAQGIRIELIVSPQYQADAPSRPYQPQAFPGMWGGHPLSSADPALSGAYFSKLLGMLDARGIVLAGLELGNEINWAGFNAEFPLPGEGRVFDLNGLTRDPEGQRIAAGYLQYIKILAVLKQARDASHLNRDTPIISAGLSSSGPARVEPASTLRKEDAVTINATLAFLRANGMDRLVDAYGIHVYPWQKTKTARAAAMNTQVVAACRAAGDAGGKPCWVTEWGFANTNFTCPADDTARAALIAETMDEFRALHAQGRLVGEMYFAWDTDPWSKLPDPLEVYRCGGLTEGGRLAITP